MLAHERPVARLRRARVQLHQRAAAEVEPPAGPDRADAVQLPAVRERAALERAAERQHAELEHVARGVRLGPGVEQQPPRAPAGELGGAGGSIGGDRVVERGRRGVARASPAA